MGTKGTMDFRRILENSLIGIAIFTLIIGTIYYLPSVSAVSSEIGSKELPIYNVDTDKKQVAISFDTADGNEDTQTILNILAKHDIHVSFFLTGDWIENYPDDVKAIAAAGHDLGNLSENHKDMSKLNAKEIKEEIVSVSSKVKELTGQDMTLFRPPYGDYNNQLLHTAKECGYYTIHCNIDSLDWKNYGVNSIIQTICENKDLGNGSIILMHNGGKYTASALEAVITNLKSQGYEIVPISELIYKNNYYIDNTGKQISNSKQI